MSTRTPAVIATMSVLGLLITGCATAGASTSASEPTPSATQDTARFEEMVEVAPGRELAVTCVGEGDPTVIFLHGLIQPGDAVSWAHSPELRSRISPETRFCEYERTNVGRSSAAEGPIPLSDAVSDLDAVIDGAGISEPVVLVGASFGGILAYTYAGSHPDRVAGVVLLDPTLPEEPVLDAMLPEADRLTEDSWTWSSEKIDVLGAYAVAQAALTSVPAVPGTIFVTEELWAPDGDMAEAFRAEVRRQQAALIAHFTPGTTVTVDAPHTMIGVVPDEIAGAVLEIVEGGA